MSKILSFVSFLASDIIFINLKRHEIAIVAGAQHACFDIYKNPPSFDRKFVPFHFMNCSNNVVPHAISPNGSLCQRRRHRDIDMTRDKKFNTFSWLEI